MSKILLVEDDADILDLTAYVLRRERYIVIEARDGAQALRRWKTDRPDIIVLDLGLPSLDGFEVLRQIREEEEETPILVLTGRRDAKDLLRCFNLGTDDFLPKPFEFRELSVRIRAILRRAGKRHREEAQPRVGGGSGGALVPGRRRSAPKGARRPPRPTEPGSRDRPEADRGALGGSNTRPQRCQRCALTS